MQLEDYIHQAFSEVLAAKQKGEALSFEGTNVPSSRGPLNDQNVLVLDGSCGLLGHSHPLIIKNYFKLAINGALDCHEQVKKSLIEEIEDYLSRLTGKSAFLNATAVYSDHFLGRSTNFLNESSKELLENSNTISLKTIIGSNYGISRDPKSKKTSDPLTIRYSDLVMLKEILKFLWTGQFYGENGLIKGREEQLIRAFKQSNKFSSASGLVVSLYDEVEHPQVISFEKKLIFPLSFDEEILSKTLGYVEAA